MVEIVKDKQFYLLLFAWFVLTYIILWFIGGGCTDILSGGTCISQKAVEGLANIPFLNLLLPFNEWFSLMYWFSPIAGFIFGYFVIKWYTEYYSSKFALSPWFLVILVLFLFVGYFINLSWYYGESARLNSRNGVTYDLYFCFSETNYNQCSTIVSNMNQQYVAIAKANSLSTVKQLIPVYYWSELRESIYLTFIIGAILAWIPLFLQNFINSRKE